MPAGRKPIPTVIKAAQGNLGHRPPNPHEAQGKPLSMTPPPEFRGNKELSAVYKKVVKAMVPAGLLLEFDLARVVSYCKNVVLHKKAEAQLEKDGEVFVTKTGYQSHTPWYKIMRDCEQAMRLFWDAYGMSAASRSKIKAMPTNATGKGTAERVIATIDFEAVKKAAEEWEPPAMGVTG